MRFIDYIVDIDESDNVIELMTNWTIKDRLMLSEVFDSKNQIQITRNDDFMFITSFYIKDVKYTFMARNEGNNTFNILFYPSTGDSISFELLNTNRYIGHIYSSVFDSIRLLMKNNVVDVIVLTSDDDHRSLYDKMTKWIEKRFPFKLENGIQKKSTVYIYKRI